MIDVGRYRDMTVDDENLVICNQNNFQHDTAVGAWKQRWVVLSK